MRQIRWVKTAFLLVCAVMSALGVALLAWPGLSAQIPHTALALTAMVWGGVRLAGYFSNDLYHLAFQFDLAAGVLSLFLGLALLLRSQWTLTDLPAVIGVVVLSDSALRLQTALDARQFGMERWWSILLAAGVGTLAGSALLLHPFESGRAMVRLMGAALAASGGEGLLMGFYTVKTPRAPPAMK